MVSNVKKLHSKRNGFAPFMVASQPGQGQKPVKRVSFKRLRSMGEKPERCVVTTVRPLPTFVSLKMSLGRLA